MRVWDPFREMETLRREIDRAFTNYSAEAGTGRARVGFLPGHAARAYPLLNFSQDHDNLYLEALAPGVDPATLDITIVRNMLTISGEKSPPHGVPVEAFHRSERAPGKFQRTLELPVEVDPARVAAQYRDGILHLTLPKAEQAKPRQITVAVE